MSPVLARDMRVSSFLAALVLLAQLYTGVVCAASTQTPAQRIVSLAPSLTELTFAAGAGSHLAAVVEYSDYPPQARELPRIGDAFRVDLERLMSFQPDVVLAWESGTPLQMIERLRALHFNVVVISTRRLADVPAALRQIGQLAGTQAHAERSARQFETRIDVLREQYRGRPRLGVFVQVNDRPIYTINGRHIISEMLALCGGYNVFADLNELAPAVGVEAVLAANPQVILAASDAVPDAVEQWRRWTHIDAVRTGRVYTMSSDYLTRATPRLVEGAEHMCRLLDQARASAGR